MKKILFGLFALSCVSMAAETNLYFRTGADFGGKFEVIKDEDGDYTEKDADDFAWEIAVEATKEVYQGLELGLGVAYQDHGKPKNYTYVDSGVDGYTSEFETPNFISIPLYLTAKYNFKAVNNFVPYIKANIGYSFNDEDGDLKVHGTINEPLENNPDYIVTEEWGGKADVKIENGLYYGIGAGFEYNNFTMDLMYQVNEAEAEIILPENEKFKKDYDYSRVTLSFGYKFNF